MPGIPPNTIDPTKDQRQAGRKADKPAREQSDANGENIARRYTVPHVKDFHAATLRMQAIIDVKWCMKKSPYTWNR
jgi:hypothetical protein